MTGIQSPDSLSSGFDRPGTSDALHSPQNFWGSRSLFVAVNFHPICAEQLLHWAIVQANL